MKLATKYSLLIISFIILLVDGFYIYINNNLIEEAFHEETQEEGTAVKNSYNLLLNQTYGSLRALALFIANDKDINQLFYRAYQLKTQPERQAELDQTRSQLSDKLEANWLRLQSDFLVRQLHFHFGPGSTSFLRVHRPEKYGDNMDDVRHTIVAANQQQIEVQAFETGRVYSGLRSVIPVYHQTADKKLHIGALEAGAPFESILQILLSELNIEGGVLLSEQHVVENMWPEAIIQKFNNRNIDECACYIETTTNELIWEIVRQGKFHNVSFTSRGTSILTLGEETFAVAHFPLYDYYAEQHQLSPVGAVMLWQNINHRVAQMQEAKATTIIYGILGYLIVEFLLIFGIKFANRYLKQEVNIQTKRSQENEQRLVDAQAVANVGSWEMDLVNQQLHWSDQIFKIFQLDKETFLPSYEKFLELVHPDDREMVALAYQQSVDAQAPYHIIHRLLLDDGTIKYVEERAEPLFDEKGNLIRSIGSIIDITERHLLQEKDRMAKQVFLHAKEGVVITDLNSIVTDINPAFSEITGYSKADIVGQNINLLSSGKHDASFYQAMWQQLKKEGYWQGEIWNKTKSGKVFPEWLTISAIPDELGEVIHYVGLFTDISLQKEFEAQLYHSATHDQLTGLPNRTLMTDRLEQGMLLSDRTQQQLALMFIDLDGFKGINDSYGHDAGDQVLISSAARLLHHCRKTDTCVRLGGDEFLLIFSQLNDQEKIINITKSILQSLAEPTEFNGIDLSVSASIGIRFYQPRENADTEQLLKDADKAMYEAKQSSKNTYRVFRT